MITITWRKYRSLWSQLRWYWPADGIVIPPADMRSSVRGHARTSQWLIIERGYLIQDFRTFTSLQLPPVLIPAASLKHESLKSLLGLGPKPRPSDFECQFFNLIKLVFGDIVCTSIVF